MKSITFDRVVKSWADAVAVNRISFTVPEGSFTVLLGPSGCGKSTTLRLLAGLEDCSGGQILIDGEDVTHQGPSSRNLSMVFQSYALFPHLSVAENILFGQKIRKVSKADQQAQLQKTASLLNLQGLLDRKPSQLSGGQQQRVALGRAIISEKPICLMDEPLSNLDAKLRHEMRVEIRELQQKLGITMVYVTHDQVEAISMADQIVLLNNGQIEQIATPTEIYQNPATAFTARFIGTPPMNLLSLENSEGVFGVSGSNEKIAEVRSEGAPEKLVMGVRPEDVLVGEQGIRATVISSEFLGADTLVDCRIGTETLTLRTDKNKNFAQGESLFLSWKEDDLHVFDANSGSRLEKSDLFGNLQYRAHA
ncbi:ABC transporter ATP-binding protein [Sneathiella limimaris]|uniref:ABC transporter ATP-binding protein n=1 Tax=Sneathiella limimaris TaxID=1964213 RepID=UPI00146E5CDB|nr:ABC transporter ATP-binding protein [Sneathiella limimaris]